MPTHHSLGPNDSYGIKNARAATIEPDEQSAVDPTQVRPAWRARPEHIELMPQDQDLGFQPPSRLEAVAQRTDEEEGNCNHQPQSCSDSAAAVTPADGVFGSDRGCIHAKPHCLFCLDSLWVKAQNYTNRDTIPKRSVFHPTY